MYLFRGDCLGLKDQHPGCGSLAAVSSQAGGHPALQFLLTPATLSGKQSSSNLSPRITAIRKKQHLDRAEESIQSSATRKHQSSSSYIGLGKWLRMRESLKEMWHTFSVMLDDAKAWSLNLCAMVASTSSWLRWAMGRL